MLDGLWPVVIGVGLALGLRRIGWSLPRVPVGDSIVLGEGAFHRLLNPWAVHSKRSTPVCGNGRRRAFRCFWSSSPC